MTTGAEKSWLWAHMSVNRTADCRGPAASASAATGIPNAEGRLPGHDPHHPHATTEARQTVKTLHRTPIVTASCILLAAGGLYPFRSQDQDLMLAGPG